MGLFYNLKASLTFIGYSLRNHFRTKKFDRLQTFQGKISADGVASFNCDDSMSKKLNEFWFRFRSGSTSKNIVLEESDRDLVEKLTALIAGDIKSYLGPEGYIDGVNWMITESSAAKTVKASNWHTDNVGSRLKAFFCVSGDGTQPTLVIPRKRRIPNLRDWFTNTRAELTRWFGEENKDLKKEQFVCAHKTGTCYVFDTSLLHRGGYESGTGERVILQFEFSVPAKHSIVNGPIGTTEENSFHFSEKLLDTVNFSQLLDPKRIFNRGDGYCDYRNL